MELEGRNRRWRQERRGNRVSAAVEVLEATPVLAADAKPHAREYPRSKTWRAIVYARWEERVQPGPGAHHPWMGLPQGNCVPAGTCVHVFVQAGDCISGRCTQPRLRLRLRGGNHQKWGAAPQKISLRITFWATCPKIFPRCGQIRVRGPI